jgi:hypothetical protein
MLKFHLSRDRYKFRGLVSLKPSAKFQAVYATRCGAEFRIGADLRNSEIKRLGKHQVMVLA